MNKSQARLRRPHFVLRYHYIDTIREIEKLSFNGHNNFISVEKDTNEGFFDAFLE